MTAVAVFVIAAAVLRLAPDLGSLLPETSVTAQRPAASPSCEW